MLFPLLALVDQITRHGGQSGDSENQKSDDYAQHFTPRTGTMLSDRDIIQKALPMKGSMLPQYMTPTQRNMADKAAALALSGASSPEFSTQVSSNMVK